MDIYVIYGKGYNCPEDIWTPTMVAEHARGERECSDLVELELDY